MKISVISPVYEAEEIVDQLVFKIHNELIKITNDYEIILIDDGSKDNSWEKIKQNCINNINVKGLKLSRNFGQHKAIAAGSKNATGDFIILMDCDLQDDPVYIKNLLYELKNGFDIVFTNRLKRKDSLFKRISSMIFNSLSKILSEIPVDINEGTLVGFNKKVQNSFNNFNDPDRLSIHVLKWLGFNSTTIKVEHKHRFQGSSSYNLSKLIKLALLGLTSQSYKLLRLSIYFGFILALIAIVISIFIIIRYFYQDFNPGWPSIIVAILFSTGMILISLGIVGIYIGKILEQSKRNPFFIVQNEINFK